MGDIISFKFNKLELLLLLLGDIVFLSLNYNVLYLLTIDSYTEGEF